MSKKQKMKARSPTKKQLNLIANKSATQLYTGACPQADCVRLNHSDKPYQQVWPIF